MEPLNYNAGLRLQIEQIIKGKYPGSDPRVFFRIDNVQLVFQEGKVERNFALGLSDRMKHMSDEALEKHVWEMRAVRLVC